MRRKRSDDSPMRHQVAAVRAELHEYVDRWCDDWPVIDKWASLAIRGGGLGERRSNEHADPTANAVVSMDEDPWNRWLERFRAFRVEARLVEAARDHLRPVSQREKERMESEQAVEPCARCGIPNPKVHRIDGRPYCAKAFDSHGMRGEACYFIEWRERRRANTQTA